MKRILLLAVLAFAVAPAAALAAGGIPGGGGTARPVGGGGGGVNSNGGAQLASGLAPMGSDLLVNALVQYRSDASRTTLRRQDPGLDPPAGQTLDLWIDGVPVVEFTVPSSRTYSFSYDSAGGDVIPSVHTASVLLLTTQDVQNWIGLGNFVG